jgi:hypothetical protein
MPSLTSVALSRNSGGYLEVLATSTVIESEPTVWHAWEDPDGNWTGWRPFGKPGHRPATVNVVPHVTDGRLEAFVATERDPSVWHRWQTQPGTSNWSQWEPMAAFDGGIQAGPLATGLTDGRLMAVVVNGGQVMHATQWNAADEAWPTWTPLGRPNGARVLDVAAAPRAREFAHLFARAHASTAHEPPTGEAADLWHRWQATPDTWSIWQPLDHPGRTAGPPVVAMNGDDRLEVFTIDPATGRMWHRSQRDTIDPDNFRDWAPVAGGGPGGDHGPGFHAAAAALDGTGRLVLIALTHGSDVWTTTETAPGSGKYVPWAKLAEVPPAEHPGAQEGLLASPALIRDSRGLMQLFVMDRRTKGLYQVSAAAVDHWEPAAGTAWPHP